MVTECIRATLCANPVMVTAGGLHRAACCTTETKASSAGTFCVRGIQFATCCLGTKPFVSTDGSAVFDRAVRIAVGTHPSFFCAVFAESRCLSSANDKTTATPGFIRRAHCVRTVRLVAARTFPAVYARGIRIINLLALFIAPTVMLRAGFGLQMPDFAPGIGFVNKAVPRVVVRKGRAFAGGIINLMALFAVPVTLRARFR